MEINPLSLAARILRFIPIGKLYAVRANHERLTETIRKAVCAFQAEYTLYQYSTANAHMDFKDSFEHLMQTREEGKKGRELEEAEMQSHQDFKNFYNYANCQLKVVSGIITDHIENYFKNTRTLAEGNCKVGVYLFVDGGNLVNIEYESDVKKPENHTIFDRVVTHGDKAYLDNCIPLTCKEDREYKDTGLHSTRAAEYESPKKDGLFLSRLLRSSEAKISKKWNDCRQDSQKEGLCKSHIAVPITFSAHTSAFAERDLSVLKAGHKEDQAPEIHGVIIVDYPETYFFDKTSPQAAAYGNADINVLYQFADMLSLAILVNRNYYRTSRTIEEYSKHYPEEYGEVVENKAA